MGVGGGKTRTTFGSDLLSINYSTKIDPVRLSIAVATPYLWQIWGIVTGALHCTLLRQDSVGATATIRMPDEEKKAPKRRCTPNIITHPSGVGYREKNCVEISPHL